MNILHDIREGRGFIKFNLQMYLLTALILILGAVALVIFVLSGPIAGAVGSAIGLGSVALIVWSIAKWFVLAFSVVIVIASAGFFFYVANFGNYNKTYGVLGGVIVLLLWTYIVNVILLFGAEIDSELERGRELQAGLPAEEDLQLPSRDTKASDKKERKSQEDIERAHNLRKTAGQSQE